MPAAWAAIPLTVYSIHVILEMTICKYSNARGGAAIMAAPSTSGSAPIVNRALAGGEKAAGPCLLGL